jgi:hypothetical protein
LPDIAEEFQTKRELKPYPDLKHDANKSKIEAFSTGLIDIVGIDDLDQEGQVDDPSAATASI